MQALKKNGIVVYIKQDFEAIRKRVGNLNKRGVVIRQGTTLRALYDERVPLYEKYADLVVDVSRSRSLKESIDMVISAIENCGLL
jgi:shikimate kinase